MPFWGVEVKPGRPFIHPNIKEWGPLRLSQATLGIGTATERSVLQCIVGELAPVLLCSLLPDRIESTFFDLEFYEKDDVVFSVIGPRSIHLAGYYIGGSSRRGGCGDASESESYGEDIWETGSNESGSYHSSEDKYESDFIDDGGIELSPSPRNNGGAVVEEIIEDGKPVHGNPTRRRLRKKHQISDSDEGDVGSEHKIIVNPSTSLISESEEEHGFPISFSVGNKDKEKNIDLDAKVGSKALDVDKKRKHDVVVLDKDFEREDEVVAVSNGKLKKKKDRIKSAKSLETDTSIHDENIRDKQNADQNKYTDAKKDEVQPCEGENAKINEDRAHEVAVAECSGKPKKRKKEKVRRSETPETRVELAVNKFEVGACMEKIDTMNNIVQANNGDNEKDLLGKSGHQRVPDEKDILGSHDKLKRKKKKAKDKSSLDDEIGPAEILRKDENDEHQITEVLKSEPSKSHKKKDKDQTVDGRPPEMTANIIEEPIPAGVVHGQNRKKQKKKKSR